MTNHTRKSSPNRTGRRGAGYPKRSPFFFHRFVRWLIKTCAAMSIGADGCFLCTIVAATEDSKRYRSAVQFYNAQLAMLGGWSIDTLDRVRRRCIDEGFLHYERGGNRTPGLYWVLVDDSLADAPELGPIGELESDFSPQVAEHPADNSAIEPRGSHGQTREEPAELTYRSFPKSSPPPPQSDRLSVTPTVGGDSNEWTGVEGELSEIGLRIVGSTVRAAQERGYSPETVLALIAHYRSRPNAWGPGAIADRIRESPATLPPEDGWPEPRAVVAVDREREATAARLAEEAEHSRKVADERKALDALEEQYGDEIDAVPIAELALLVPEGPPRNSLRSQGWRSGLIRGLVLRRWQSERTNGKDAMP